VDIQDDGTVKVASSSGESIKAAINWIKSIASDPEVGQVYDGTVVKVMDFGAFVNFFGSRDGLVHISQLAPRRVQKTTDVVKEGDKVKVKLLGFDERGKVRLSMKMVDQQTGEDLEAKQKAEAADHREAAGGEESARQMRGSIQARAAAAALRFGLGLAITARNIGSSVYQAGRSQSFLQPVSRPLRNCSHRCRSRA